MFDNYGPFWTYLPTYLPMSDVFSTMPITLVQFLLRYLPTPKSDVLYECSLMLVVFQVMNKKIFPPYLFILVCLFIRKFRIPCSPRILQIARFDSNRLYISRRKMFIWVFSITKSLPSIFLLYKSQNLNNEKNVVISLPSNAFWMW